MNKKSRPKSPNLRQFTLSDEAIQVLDHFTNKYGTIKSEIVNRALLLLGAKYHVKLLISLEMIDSETTTTTTKTRDPYVETATRHIKKYNDDEEISDEEMVELINSINKHGKNYKPMTVEELKQNRKNG